MGSENATGVAQILTDLAEQQGATRFNAAGQMEQKVYFSAGFTQYRPYLVANTAAAATSPAAIAAATEADAVYRVCVPQGTTTSTAGWYWAVIQGVCQALVDGSTDVANGGFLEVINAGVAFILDHATAPTVNASAITRAAVTADAATETEVYLIGRFSPVAGS